MSILAGGGDMSILAGGGGMSILAGERGHEHSCRGRGMSILEGMGA